MWHYIYSFLFPERCVGCNTYGIALCEHCKSHITFAPTIAESTTIALFDYDNELTRKILWQCKYHRKTAAFESLVKAAAPHLVAAIAERLGVATTAPLVFVPIPQHWKRTRYRGYNQSLLTARLLHRAIAQTTVQNVLIKIKETTPQALLKNKKDRLKNVADSMHYKRRVSPDALYIVVDDITTTGATLSEATRALRKAGATQIIGAAIAHGFRTK